MIYLLSFQHRCWKKNFREVQKYRSTEVQKYRSTEVQKYRSLGSEKKKERKVRTTKGVEGKKND
ncbi:hypothetical protein AALA13_10270 [Lachnospiraceae bacterium 50-23]